MSDLQGTLKSMLEQERVADCRRRRILGQGGREHDTTGNLHQIIRMLGEGKFTAEGLASVRLALSRAESKCEPIGQVRNSEELLPDWGCYDTPAAPAAVVALNQAGCELVERIWEERGVAEALRRVRATQREHAGAGADDTEGREALWELVKKACAGTVYNPDGLWARYYSS